MVKDLSEVVILNMALFIFNSSLYIKLTKDQYLGKHKKRISLTNHSVLGVPSQR